MTKKPKGRAIPIQTWVDCLRESSQEIATQTLRFDAAPPARKPGTADGQKPAAYIALLGEDTSVHLGISMTAEGCRAIARGLLGAHSSVELSDHEISDGVNEVLNIVAGKVKSRMVNHDPSLKLGLPMFVVGEIRVTEGMERASTTAKLGPVDCELLVFRRLLAA